MLTKLNGDLQQHVEQQRQKILSKEATVDRDAVGSAVRGANLSKPAAEPAPDFGRMSPDEFHQWKRQNMPGIEPMMHFTIKRQQERERREWLERKRLFRETAEREQQRIAELRNQWPQILAARANAVLAGYQRATYDRQVQRLVALANWVGGG